MKRLLTVEDLRTLVKKFLMEKKGAKKTKSKKGEKDVPKSPGFQSDERLDFSIPLGDYNVYRHQGAANWGPHTSTGPDTSRIPDELKENVRELSADLGESAWLTFIRPNSGGWKGILEDFVAEEKKG